MALEKKTQINSLVVRWDKEGNYQGASTTNLIEVFEDGKLIASKETNPLDIGLDDLGNQKKVADVIGQVQIDQANTIKQKDSEKDALGILNQSLANNLEDEKAKFRALELEHDAVKRQLEDKG